MIQYPKQEHITLPAVEMWGTNMNILKDPPKGIYTRRIDKVGDTQEITEWIDASGDRACEAVKVYARGVNPMVSVSYQNYGTNGGQMRQADGVGRTTAIGTGQAKYPYRVMRDGAFRPPVLTPQNLLPLSRLPRVWTSAFTNIDFPNFAKRMECPKFMREVKREVITTSVRPTARFEVETLVEPFEVKYVITDPLNVEVQGRVIGGDITEQEVKIPLKELGEYSTVLAQTNVTGGYTREAEKGAVTYQVQPIEHIEVRAKETRDIDAIPLDQRHDQPIALKEVQGIPHSTKISGHTRDERLHKDLEFERKTPMTQIISNPSSNRREVEEPSRKVYIRPKVNPGGYEGDRRMPSLEQFHPQPNLQNGMLGVKQQAAQFQEDRFKN